MNRTLPKEVDRREAPVAVHPVAALFPMLSEPELRELADDIKANGQRFPIIIAVMDGESVLIDGRNRLAACELAEIEPWFQELEKGDDPVAFIISANAARRQMTAGALAM